MFCYGDCELLLLFFWFSCTKLWYSAHQECVKVVKSTVCLLLFNKWYGQTLRMSEYDLVREFEPTHSDHKTALG